MVGTDTNSAPFYEKDFQAPVEVPDPGHAGSLSAIGCLCHTCTAVGEDGNGQPFAVNEIDNTWATPVEVTLPGSTSGRRRYFFGVSCTPDTAQCNAVGTGTLKVGHTAASVCVSASAAASAPRPRR